LDPDGTACTDDGYSCTEDTCDGSGSCESTPDDSACDDSNVCTVDECSPGDDADEDTGCIYSYDPDTSECEAGVTNSSLCPFDIDTSSPNDSQFRLIYTPDPTLPTSWKLNASNPGQFYYNMFYAGPGEETVTITLPYPFVTQGARPVHIYANVSDVDAKGCIVPGAEVASEAKLVALTDYVTSTKEVGVGLPALPSGFAYINIHLDYGLKGTKGYSKDAGNNAIDATTLALRIAENKVYGFSDSEGGSDTAKSKNEFKHDPGFAGLVLAAGTNDPVPNVAVQIYDSANKLLKTVYTDTDGWYMWQYKHTGKAATFTLKLPAYNKSQTVTLKSNVLVIVSFSVP
jgi:hypothetical protein